MRNPFKRQRTEQEPEPDELEIGHARDRLTPLPGERPLPKLTASASSGLSWKGLLAVGMFCSLLLAAAAFAAHRYLERTAPQNEQVNARERPVAAGTEPRRLELPPAPASRPDNSGVSSNRIPALIPTEEEVEPIGVRRTGSGRGKGKAPADKPYDPRDDPVMIISSPPEPLPDDNAPAASGQLGSSKLDPVETALRHPAKDMDAYQRQLQAALDHLTRTATTAANNATAATGRTPPSPVAGQAPPGTVEGPDGAQITPPLFGGELQATHTPPIKARLMPNRSLTMPKGTAFTCALKTKVISGASGMVGCMVQRDIYGDDGKVLLVERGSHMDGEYRSVSVRPGMVRLPVMWTRIRTPHGVLVELNSPGTGQLGEAGIDGYVDNRWPERLGAAMLLSMIDDAVQLVIENQKEDPQGDTIVLPGTTANSSRLAEKVLDSTINIPPVMYQNQGGIVGVYVARDIDFSAVYRLKLSPLSTAASGVDLNAEQK